MPSKVQSVRDRSSNYARLRWVFSCGVALLIFAVDTFTSLQSAVAVLYILVLLIADDGESRRPIPSFGIASAVLTVASFVLTHASRTEVGSLLRLLFSLAILSITAMLLVRNRTMQSAMRDNDLRYRTIFETLAVAIWEHDFRDLQKEMGRLRAAGVTDLRSWLHAHPHVVHDLRALVLITNANKSAFTLLQVPDGEPFFTDLSQILPEDDESFLEGLLVLEGGGALFETETRLRTWHGEMVDVFVALTFPSGAGLGCISGSVTDVTKRKRFQSELDRARSQLDKAVRAATASEMSASIAHEVSQPLTAVRTCIEAGRRWLDRAPPDVGKALNAMKQAAREAENAGEVVNRVRRRISRVEPDLAALDIDPVVEIALEVAQRQFDWALLTLVPGAEHVQVLGDRILLQQLLINIISNAVEACGNVAEGARILVKTAWDDKAASIIVIDDGPGMVDDTAQRAFDPFFSTRVGGIGLGLTMCRSIVEAHGGTIAIAPRTDNIGTAVTIQLPRLLDL